MQDSREKIDQIREAFIQYISEAPLSLELLETDHLYCVHRDYEELNRRYAFLIQVIEPLLLQNIEQCISRYPFLSLIEKKKIVLNEMDCCKQNFILTAGVINAWLVNVEAEYNNLMHELAFSQLDKGFSDKLIKP